MPAYKHVFFDLDHTLWDFDKNCAETLQELYDTHQLHHLGFDVPTFVSEYRKVNDAMWEGYHRKKITKEEIRTQRFINTFQNMGFQKEHVPKAIDEDFIRICPTKPHLHDHAFDVLNYLNEKKYILHIITNGFKETQQVKMSCSGLDKYFNHVINSELCGYMKPDRRIFDHAVSLAGTEYHCSIMIGDDLYADVLGARDAGMDHVFYNPNGKDHEEDILHEIESLAELKRIL